LISRPGRSLLSSRLGCPPTRGISLARLCRHRRADELRSEPERCASSGRHLHGPDFQGVKPADLRIEQSVRIKLAINLKTAKSLGITLPTTLLARADEVIE
jgi:hypothetical protein